MLIGSVCFVSKLCQISRSPETEKCKGRSYVSEGWAPMI